MALTYYEDPDMMTVLDRFPQIEEEERVASLVMHRRSYRLKGENATTENGSTFFEQHKALSIPTSNYQDMGGQKSWNNRYLATLAWKACQKIDGKVVVIDASNASTCRAMFDVEIDCSRVVAVTKKHTDMREMTKTLYALGATKTLTYEGDFFECMYQLSLIQPVALVYADLTGLCPVIGSKRYESYIRAIYALVDNQCIKKGSIFAFTHSLTPRQKKNMNFTFDHTQIIDTLEHIFTEAGIDVMLKKDIIYKNVEARARTKMSFVVFEVTHVHISA
jgi:hypothetical protein